MDVKIAQRAAMKDIDRWLAERIKGAHTNLGSVSMT
jgi:hypothetical protein